MPYRQSIMLRNPAPGSSACGFQATPNSFMHCPTSFASARPMLLACASVGRKRWRGSVQVEGDSAALPGADGGPGEGGPGAVAREGRGTGAGCPGAQPAGRRTALVRTATAARLRRWSLLMVVPPGRGAGPCRRRTAGGPRFRPLRVHAAELPCAVRARAAARELEGAPYVRAGPVPGGRDGRDGAVIVPDRAELWVRRRPGMGDGTRDTPEKPLVLV
ncbi:hypothetical protein GCM10010305_36360 [Streptomyces termitum]|uniref:Uncharacterized protein n=1 Tax=Streptomyces termitum TaxID=67368 RepID=A0A918T3Q3_9ACTN|nr:hypothetical protein GCM10010305_36360 [Streptomyces termitum]